MWQHQSCIIWYRSRSLRPLRHFRFSLQHRTKNKREGSWTFVFAHVPYPIYTVLYTALCNVSAAQQRSAHVPVGYHINDITSSASSIKWTVRIEFECMSCCEPFFTHVASRCWMNNWLSVIPLLIVCPESGKHILIACIFLTFSSSKDVHDFRLVGRKQRWSETS